MAKRRLAKKAKRVLLLFIVIAIFVVGFFILKNSDLFAKPIYFDNQYIDGIIFTDISYSKKNLNYCYHYLYDIKDDQINNLAFKIDEENNVDVTTSDNKCNTIKIDIKPEVILLINKVNDDISVKATDEMEENFNTCNNNATFPYEDNEVLNNKKDEMTKLLKNTTAGVYYEDVTSGFSYGYNENGVFYGASLIKLPEALYLVDEATKGNISLDDTLLLTSYYYNLGNDGLKSNRLNSRVTIGNLIKYMLETSDNGAHLLLFDNLTGNNLTSYEKSLGSTHLYNRNIDKFGTQTAKAMSVYLKHAYEIITNNETYGPSIKKYMVNDFYNNLKLDDGIDVAHKYGYIDKNPKFHDVGIVFNEHPYTISVLTFYSKEKGSKFINDTHKEIKELHELFYEEKTNYCIKEAYFNI